MNIDRGKESYTEADIEAVRRRLVEHKAYESLSWPELARRIGGVGDSTLSGFSTGNYRGDNAEIAWKVNRYFLAEEARREEALLAPVVPDFRMTRTARTMMGQLRWAHGGEMVAIVGNPGMSKTSTFRHYCRVTPNAFIATMNPATRAVQPMLQEVLRSSGAPGKAAVSSTLFAILCERLKGARALIIVDEAQHLTDVALDQLRAIHDRLDCGIVLAGNATVLTRVQGAARQADFAQLSSRVSWSETYLKPHPEDVAILLEAWGVGHELEREFLAKVAAQPGALRLMTQVLKMATLAARAEDEARTLSHLRDALKQLQQRPSLALGAAA
jgi:DNA transposition AAA+ family ATPase